MEKLEHTLSDVWNVYSSLLFRSHALHTTIKWLSPISAI